MALMVDEARLREMLFKFGADYDWAWLSNDPDDVPKLIDEFIEECRKPVGLEHQMESVFDL